MPTHPPFFLCPFSLVFFRCFAPTPCRVPSYFGWTPGGMAGGAPGLLLARGIKLKLVVCLGGGRGGEGFPPFPVSPPPSQPAFRMASPPLTDATRGRRGVPTQRTATNAEYEKIRGGFSAGDEGARPNNGFLCRSSLGLRQRARAVRNPSPIWHGGTFALRGARRGNGSPLVGIGERLRDYYDGR